MTDNSSPTPRLIGPQQVAVLTASAAPRAFSYLLEEGQEAAAGALVYVPLGRSKSLGVVLGAAEEKIAENKLKHITHFIEAPPLQPALLQLVDWVADYTLAPAGNVLAMCLGGQNLLQPTKRKARGDKKDVLQHPHVHAEAPILSSAQKTAAEKLAGAVKAKKFSVSLLDGVTGSGKTEVYCEAIAEALSEGRQALLMLPEIALTTQLGQRLEARFGTPPALWHSGLTPAQRRRFWLAVATGETKLVIGARSALFLPFAKLGLIIVDEEHDASYKQEDGVIYHARDMAVVRGKLENIPVVLASATPSLETLVNVEAGRYSALHLPERHADAQLPAINLIDLKEEKLPAKSWISPTLQSAITETLAAGQQALLFLNRRGYAPLTLCRACGARIACPQCSSWLVEHRSDGRHKLACHHCDYARPYPASCPNCKVEGKLAACGPGIERLEEEVAKLFPSARRATLASDTATNMKALHGLVEDMARGRIDILIGTQIVAKGYHFPQLTLVGVIDGDLGLQGGDPRAAERTFQLLYQVAGRSGREDVCGRVYIQTTQPTHAVMQDLKAHNRDRLMATLIEERKKFSMPPFARLATLTLSAANKDAAEKAARQMAQNIPPANGFSVLGPAPAPLSLLRGKHRLRFLIKCRKDQQLQDYIRAWVTKAPPPKSIRLHVDVDPQSFL